MREPRELIAESMPVLGATRMVSWRDLLSHADLVIKRLQEEGYTIIRTPTPEYPPDHPVKGDLGSVPL